MPLATIPPQVLQTLPKLTEDLAFMAAEITGDEMYFNAISRRGQTVDSGVLIRRKATP